MIEVTGARKSFGDRVALDGLSFTVPRGEIFGFVGANGAGKTTTIRILATLLPIDAGEAIIAGSSVQTDPYGVRNMVGYMPDYFGVYQGLTAKEYLEFYAGVHKVPRARRSVVADELLELVGLADRASDDVDVLSRGHKQRLCLARALVHDPAVLLLDEPASGLDPRAQIEMREVIKELKALEKTVLVSSHLLPELEEMCTWVGLIDEGRTVATGPMQEVRNRVGRSRRVRVEVADPEQLTRASSVADGFGGVLGSTVVDGSLELDVDEKFADHDLLSRLVQDGIKVRSLAPVSSDLAEVFMRLTQKT